MSAQSSRTPSRARQAAPRKPAAAGGGGAPKGGGKGGGRRGGGAGAAAAAERLLWSKRAWALLLGLALLRLALNALGLIPVHFDEAQYWAYGREMAFGHYSKPPLVGWLILASTSVLGDTAFALRFFAPLAHLAVGAGVFLTARRLFDARTGFWAALLYSAAPGVSISAGLMTTDPVMMAGWALALYALVRAMEVEPGPKMPEPWGWWALVGLGVGLGMLAKYTAIALPLGLIGYVLFSREAPLAPSRRRGAGLAAGVALLVLSPNLAWNAAHGFVTITHLGENAEVGRGGLVHPEKLAEFLGAQFGVIGPVAFLAVLAALVTLPLDPARRGDWRERLLAWSAAPLLAAMCVQAFLSQANANWAAPAYVGGSILAARWLLARPWGELAGKVQAGVGIAAVVVVFALGGVYDLWGRDLPRFADPFKKMRNGGPFCEAALSAMEGEGAQVLLSNDRRRLSECLFEGGMDFKDVAVWDPDGTPSNHFEFRSRLEPGDDRLMLLAVESAEQGEEIAARFAWALPVGEGAFATHSDRSVTYVLWAVEGFEGY
ncbi:glycosyltransferase family 39 protein [Albimonas sp. CAU 1670]|uniref:ArnT family glycosyltransferase n=1 Tax=Albimonas sp. CAU 1670 TaxID=3032599 RepID=UPI0023D9BFB9|nr:glycosyltransferase family 39 protein [Albimonas sp. CAU 1670]MDF2235813.1 glycosyltransferase family 39 protein [Albimonas sp. CAU 1670]